MRYVLSLLLAGCVLAGGPPKSKVENVSDTLHGVTVNDPYRWLEDQDSPETRAWIAEQMEHTRSVLDAIPGREAIRKRLAELMRVDTMSTPSERGGRYFFTKRLAGQNQAVLVMRQGLKGEDQVLVDPNTMTGISA